MPNETFLRLPAVIRKVGFSKSRIYALIAQGDFPRPVHIGKRASAWIESEVDGWIDSRIQQSRRAA